MNDFYRIGHGFDVHRLETGEGMMLGGVFIACPYKIIAHSDGDVIIHALCDALLGAIGGGDIGKLFPDSDVKYRGMAGQRLLADVTTRVKAAGFEVINADLTLIAQVPRVAPHADKMRDIIAGELAIAIERVNVKATTNEGMGHIGRAEGIAAHAVVILGKSNAPNVTESVAPPG
jgi:2-C-methyl-D-erythritol 2,4-cyclodiphosphate synthase